MDAASPRSCASAGSREADADDQEKLPPFAKPLGQNTHSECVQILNSVFKDVGTGFGGDHALQGVDAANLQYGEVTYAGMDNLYGALDLSPGDVFYDLGSGTGKLVMYVALRGADIVARSVGLEVGENRHRLAEKAKGKLDEHLSRGATPSGRSAETRCAHVSIERQDITKERYRDVTTVVMTNLCWDMGLQSRTLDAILRCPTLKRIVCTTAIPPHKRLRKVKTVQVQCSWAKVSSWHVYEVLPPIVRNAFQGLETNKVAAEPPARRGLARAPSIQRMKSKSAMLEVLPPDPVGEQVPPPPSAAKVPTPSSTSSSAGRGRRLAGRAGYAGYGA